MKNGKPSRKEFINNYPKLYGPWYLIEQFNFYKVIPGK